MSGNNQNGETRVPVFDEQTCERYLFGELSDDEQERFEAAYFADDAFFDRFIAVKTELLDLYVRRELDVGKRTRLEGQFQETAPRRKQIDASKEFIAAITSFAGKERLNRPASHAASPMPDAGRWRAWLGGLSPFSPVLRFAVIAAVVFAAVVGIWLGIQSSRNQLDGTDRSAIQPSAADLPPPVRNSEMSSGSNVESPTPSTTKDSSLSRVENDRKVRVERDKDRPLGPAPTSGLNVGGQRGTSRPVHNFTLSPGATRDISGSNTLDLTGGNDDRPINLKLVVNNDVYSRYRATIATVDGKQIWKGSGRKGEGPRPGSRTISFSRLPASLFRQSDYIVTLTGRSPDGRTEVVGEYYFHISRTPSKIQPTPTPER